MNNEQSFCKYTLFLIKDWYAYQVALRRFLNKGSRSECVNCQMKK